MFRKIKYILLLHILESKLLFTGYRRDPTGLVVIISLFKIYTLSSLLASTLSGTSVLTSVPSSTISISSPPPAL